MHRFKFAIYLGKEKTGGFTGFIAEDNFFLVLEAEGLTNEEGHKIIKKIKEDLIRKEITGLSGFEAFLGDEVKTSNIPTSFSLSSGFLKDDIFYLATFGGGEVYLRRSDDFAKIISGDNSASGYVNGGDYYIYTTTSFNNVFGGEEEIKTVFNHKGPHELVEKLRLQLKDADDQGIVALFVSIEEEEVSFVDTEIASQHKPVGSLSINLKETYKTIKLQSEKAGRKKILTVAALAVVGFILVWNVILGNQRRENQNRTKKVEATRELVMKKLDEAEESAFISLPRSIALITEAKEEVERLKKELGANKESEIKEIENLIANKENQLTKKENRSYEEFYDLALDNKEAKGSRFYLDNDSVVILDRENAVIYDLSLTKKSLTKKNYSLIKSATLAALYGDNIFFLVPDEGIYKIVEETKPKKIIEKDKDWGKIADMWIYNGNIYLLDKENNDIHKYLVAEDGYSGIRSYFGDGEAVDMGMTNSIAIDSSVFVGFSGDIKKFTAGVRDEFTTSYPEEGVSLNKVFTNNDLDRVYGWDKAAGAVYALTKKGAYQKQISSIILKKADDIVVYKDAIYALVNAKIFKVDVD
jgi:hypothetical protein